MERGMTTAAFESWVARARTIRIEDEIKRRSIKLDGGDRERVGPCPKCGGDDRFSINTKKQVWNCRQCDKGGDVIELVKHLDGVEFVRACETLTGEPPPRANGKDRTTAPKKIVAAEFPYPDEAGKLEFATERIEYQNADGTFVEKDGKRKKTFRQKRPDPNHPGKSIYNVEGCRILPYRLPELVEAIANGRPVFVVEGEGKVDLLASWNIIATCNAGGAKKWKAEHAAFLKNADVILIPDHDDAGWQHIHSVGASLTGIAKRIRVLVLPDLRPKGDVIDWACSGGTREQLDELIAKAPDWEAPKADEKKAEATRSEDELLAALAKMPKGVAYGRERKRLAKEFGVSRADIDAEIEERRVEAETTALLHGHWFVEPSEEPVEGDSLIRDIIRKLRKHVVISFESALAIALWLMLSWVHDEVATHSPILDVNSADPVSGKTTTLGVVSFLMPRAICTVDISKAALYRAIKRWQPSFVIDEFDDVLADKTDANKAELRSVINSGHTRGQGVLRCITDEHTPELFSTFATKAIGMIGRKMPPQTLSRCIFIELRRRKKDERITKFKHEDDAELADLRSRLRRWSLDNVEALRNVAPSMPDTFDNRLEDNWRLQFAIADLCSGVEDWGDRARAAAVKIESVSDSRTIGVCLLVDTKAIFYPKDKNGEALLPLERISSADLVNNLATNPDSPWAEWKKGNPITQRQLAGLLKPFGIAPQLIRLSDRDVMRGYQRTQFEDAWERYF
jgi:hypothetical protein